MGVSGCGKSSVGAALALRLGIPYFDGDDLHTPDAVAKMRDGIALTDSDRWPWLDRVASVLQDKAPVIVGCSALKRDYRDRIRAGAGGPVTFVHLAGSREVIASRMGARTGHYMPTSLLDSQFAALEPPGPEEAITVDIALELPDLVEAVLDRLPEDRGGS
ncbi:gluconokinase [Tabrizicola sp.]|uniref:gluconokinase n=1 Tax=Tabrizicola sp. TaxID=2005166 RepID=UPI002736E6C1|nr:gluconokinase [Tabrizicola sp.]MDP3198133.1 gluconokinase [Tabrizicola sp.]